MSKGKQDDELSAEESQALMQSLNERAAGGAAAEDDAPDEDLEAYLASLEGDAEPAPAAPAKAAEPDPFADAFSELEAEHGHEVVAPPPRKVEAKPAPEASKPAVKKTPEAAAPPDPADAAMEKAALAAADKKPGGKKPSVHAVETVRSRQFLLTVGAIKIALLLAPAMFAWWLSGALLGRWVGAGWIIAIVATLGVFVPPIAAKIGTGKGRVLAWAAPFGLLISVGLIAGIPGFTGESVIRYGHWPASTVAQLAGWDADQLAVRGHASASAWLGEQIQAVRPAPAPQAGVNGAPVVITPSALGTQQDLKAFADEARKKAEEAAKVAPAPAAAPADPAAPAPAAPAVAPTPAPAEAAPAAP
jgi:hypothetical protein